jgi:hypothetical protein
MQFHFNEAEGSSCIYQRLEKILYERTLLDEISIRRNCLEANIFNGEFQKRHSGVLRVNRKVQSGNQIKRQIDP